MNQNKEHIQIFATKGNCITPLGFDLEENINGILHGKTAIQSFTDTKLYPDEFIGARINQLELDSQFNQLELKGEYTSLEKMMLLAVQPIKTKYCSLFDDNCGLIISSTKGNITALENINIEEYYLSSLAKKIGKNLGIKNEPIVLSNACVSGIMAVSVAKRLIQTGNYKHFVIIGADIFSKFVFSGFQAFQAVSSQPCKPYDKNRDGITLGEAAAALFVTGKSEFIKEETFFEILGDSSINDANHISGPSRTGEGLFQSVTRAMDEANLTSSEISCISSHGTATNYNDEMEAQAFNRAGLEEIPVFSLKGYFGHTLGAAGLLETVITFGFAAQDKIPKSIGYEEHGVTLPLNVTRENFSSSVSILLKTASGFGGSNTAVLFKKYCRNEK